jgi:hypothetical protein
MILAADDIDCIGSSPIEKKDDRDTGRPAHGQQPTFNIYKERMIYKT